MKIFDLHCDTFCELFDRKLTLNDNSLAVNYAELSCFDTAVQTFSVFLHPKYNDSAYRYAEVLNCGKKALKEANIKICTNRHALENDGITALLSVEGGVPNFSPNFVEKLFLDGIRTVSLTWNYDNPIAGGCNGDGGLTVLGGYIVREINRCKMTVDLSHLNQKSFFEVIERADSAVATHTGVFSIVEHPRNLTDEQLKLIKEKDGVVGLTVYPEFIGQDPFEGFYYSVEHCLDLGLEDNLSLGSDFDGAEMYENLSKASHLKALNKYLLSKNIAQPIIDKIFFENSYKFYNRVLTNGTL